MKLPISDFRWQIDPTQRAAQIRNPQSAIRNSPAFSLIEILIVVAMLSVIILGLVAMFGQTQRAFRLGMTQTDVLEAGRMATDLIVREVEQVTPSYQAAINFYAAVPYQNGVYDAPLLQSLPGSLNRRMNLIEDVFFLTRRNQEWVGIGYFVRFNQSTNLFLSPLGAGSLYRFESSTPAVNGRPISQLFTEFNTARNKGNDGGLTKLIDGVVHFAVRTDTTNGIWITNSTGTSIVATNYFYPVQTLRGEVETYVFYSNAVPASVELEIGILEDRAWERFKSLADDAAKYRYLTNQAGRVHLFRQRIPIRNVDPHAYQ